MTNKQTLFSKQTNVSFFKKNIFISSNFKHQIKLILNFPGQILCLSVIFSSLIYDNSILYKFGSQREPNICLKLGVNFINVLRAAFTWADPKSAKRYWRFDCIFALFGSACVKASSKMLVKSTPGGQELPNIRSRPIPIILRSLV